MTNADSPRTAYADYVRGFTRQSHDEKPDAAFVLSSAALIRERSPRGGSPAGHSD
jgi:hypothetical protein